MVVAGATSIVTASVNGVGPMALKFSSNAGSLTVNGSTAMLNTSGVSPGTVIVTCTATDDLEQSSSAETVVTVESQSEASATTTTVLSASPMVMDAGLGTTLTTVVSASAGTPTGSVTFVDGSTVLGVATISSNGQAVLATGSLSAGSHLMQAKFAGTPTMASSESSVLTLQAAAPPVVSCTPNVGTVPVGGTAVVTASASSVRPVVVKFSSSAGSLTVSGITATLNAAGVLPGTVTVTCTATDDLGQSGSASATLAVEGQIGTTTVLSVSPMVVASGRGATLTAMVSASVGSPTGTVTFVDGGTVLGVATVSSSGQAVLASGSLSAGSHALQARFAGNATYSSSASSVQTLVAAAPPQVSCTAGSPTVLEGGTVTMTASTSSSHPVTVGFSSSSGRVTAIGTTATLNTTGVLPGPVVVTCTATDDLGQSGSGTVVVTVQSATGEQALTAYSFVDSVGVNVHLHDANTPYVYAFPQFLSSIVALGVHHYRNGIDPYAQSFEYQNAETLASAGIKGDWLIDANDTPANINAIYANAPDSIEAFEGPNEDDAIAGPVETAFMTMLNQTVRSNPGTQNVPIYGPTFTQLSSIAEQGSLSAFVNAGSMHDYYFPRYPETPAYGGSFFGCGGYGTMSFNICVAQVVTPGRSIVSTETGYASGEQSDAVLARYITRTLFDHLQMNVIRTYLYEFVDEVGSPGFGLMRGDFTPKPAYTELQNLMNLFNDQNFLTPAKLDITLSGSTANVNHVIFQKQDGTWMIAFWLAVESANPAAPYEDDDVPPQSVNVSIAAQLGAATLYTFDSNGVMSSAPGTVTQGTITIPVTDQVTILALAPPLQ
jgi:hypothetical protein